MGTGSVTQDPRSVSGSSVRDHDSVTLIKNIPMGYLFCLHWLDSLTKANYMQGFPLLLMKTLKLREAKQHVQCYTSREVSL